MTPEWSRKVAVAFVPVSFWPTPLDALKVFLCWWLRRPFKVRPYLIECAVVCRPDVARLEIHSMTAKVHR